MLPEHRTLLVDIENLLGTPRPKASVLRAWIDLLLQAAAELHHAVASYAVAEPGDDPIASVLAELRITPLPVAPGADAAELALLAHARHVHDVGGRVFLVASGDRRFTELAHLDSTRIEVLAREGQPVAAKLTAAAAVVHRLPRTPTAVDAADPDLVVETAGAPAALPGRQINPMVLRFGIAVITGFGIALGQRLLDILVPHRR
jgi:hypothetical protein